MKVDDIIVEVRDGALKRRGAVPARDLNITAQNNRNNVGSWTVQLPVESPLCTYLREPGAGILLTGVGTRPYSGPVTSVQEADSVEDPQGTVTFTGVTDDVICADLLAWPDPAKADVNAQRYEEDVREGQAETVMHDFVRANVGPGAVADRRNPKLAMGADYGRGGKVRKAARFETLGEVLRDVADVAGLNFSIAQYGDELRFETAEVRDRTKFVRLDVWNNTLSSHTTTVSAPAVTNVIVGGRGEGVDRWFYTKAGDATERQRWGRRIERFVENSSSDDDEVLAQTADETLATDGGTAVDVQVVPMEDAGTMVLGKDWDLGDSVTVVSNGTEEQSVVSGWILKADSSGVRVGAILGDPTSNSVESRLANTEQRVSALERRVEVVHEFDASAIKSGENLTLKASDSATEPAFALHRPTAADGPMQAKFYNASNGRAALSIDKVGGAPDGTDEWLASFYLNRDGTIESRDATTSTSFPVPRMAAGTATIGALAIGAYADVTVTFPARRFSANPIVTTGATTPRYTIGIQSLSATGATFRYTNYSNGAVSSSSVLHWQAQQF